MVFSSDFCCFLGYFFIFGLTKVPFGDYLDYFF